MYSQSYNSCKVAHRHHTPRTKWSYRSFPCRHRELLRACERRLPREHDAETKLALMREMAVIWEVEFKNRISALAIWSDVHALEPRDEEASRAVERLQALETPT